MKIVDTIPKALVARRPLRRQYSAQLKTQVVQESRAQWASVAAVALSHGINANIVHRWRREHEGARWWRSQRQSSCRSNWPQRPRPRKAPALKLAKTSGSRCAGVPAPSS